METWSLIDENIKAADSRRQPFQDIRAARWLPAPSSDDIDMAAQLNENLLMPCAAVMMELTECAKLLFVLFRGVLTHVNVPELRGEALSGWCQSR